MLSKNFFGLRGQRLNAMLVGTASIAFVLFGFGKCGLHLQ